MDSLDVNFFYFILSVVSVCICILVWLLISHDLFGSIATKLLNSYLNKYGSYISLGSLKFSLLRGNIVFKDFRYANNDYCIRSVDGIIHINWWTTKPKRDLEDSKPYRINAHLNGLEIQVYNTSNKLFALEKEDDKVDLDTVIPVEDFHLPFVNIFAPITKVHVHRGSIIIGNPLTNYISISSFHYLTFYYITEEARFPHLDYYRTRLKFEFAQFNSKISKNDDFYRDRLSLDGIISESFESMMTENENKLKKHKWHGLKRFQLHNIDVHKSRVISSPALTIDYYYDVCGPYTGDTDEEPEFAINIYCEHSNINYGSFQNKQRLILSQIFFPYNPIRTNNEVIRYRSPSVCKIRINMNENNTLIIPFLSNKPQNAKIMNTGDMSKYLQWIECNFHVAEINFNLSLTDNGKSIFNMNMLSQEDSSITFSFSNSEESFIKTDRLYVNSSMNNQKDEYTTDLEMSFFNSEVILLKEYIIHIKNMINDIIESNSLQEHELYPHFMYKNSNDNLYKDLKYINFKPSKYHYNIMLLDDFDIYLNVNERGMGYIDNFEANSYYLITGENLESVIETKDLEYDSILKNIFFNLNGSNVKVFTIYPPYHTIFKFLESDGEDFLEEMRSKRFLSTENLFIDGKYTYHLNEYQCIHKPIDHLTLNIKGNNVDFVAFGYNLKSFFDFKDNYLSKDQNDVQEIVEDDEEKKIEPEFNIFINIEAYEVNCLLPLNLYSCHNSATAKTTKVEFRIIITDDIDLSIRALPISLTLPENTTNLTLKPLLYTDRFFFNFFGNYATYEIDNNLTKSSCIKSKFDLDLGNVTALFAPNQILLLMNGFQQLSYHFSDRDNSLNQSLDLEEDYCHDLIRVVVNSLNATFWTNQGAMEVNIKNGIKFYCDTLINSKYGKFIQILVNNIVTRFFIQDQSSYVTDDSISIGEFSLEEWLEVGTISIPSFFIKNIIKINKNANDRFMNQKLHIKKGSKSRQKLKEWYETTEFECDPWERQLCKQFFYEEFKVNDVQGKYRILLENDDVKEDESLQENKNERDNLDSSDTIYLNCSQNDLPLSSITDHYIYEAHYSKPQLNHFILTKKSNHIIHHLFQSTYLFPNSPELLISEGSTESATIPEDCKETCYFIIHINNSLEISLTPEAIIVVSSLVNSITTFKHSLESILDSIQLKFTSKLFHIPFNSTYSIQTIFDIYVHKIKVLLQQKRYQEHESVHSTAITINNTRFIYDVVESTVFNSFYVPRKSKDPNCLYPIQNRSLISIDKFSINLFRYPDYYVRYNNNFIDMKELKLNVVLSVSLNSKSTLISKMDTKIQKDLMISERSTKIDISNVNVSSKQKLLGSIIVILDEWLFALNKMKLELDILSNYYLLDKLVISDSLLHLPENNINDDTIEFHVLEETSSVHRSLWRIISLIRKRFKNNELLKKMRYSCTSIHNSDLFHLYNSENLLTLLSSLEMDEELMSIIRDDPHKFHFILFDDLDYHFNRKSTHYVSFKWEGYLIDLKVKDKDCFLSQMEPLYGVISYNEDLTMKNEYNRVSTRKNEFRLSSASHSYIDSKVLFQPNLPTTTSTTSITISTGNISTKIHKLLFNELSKCIKYNMKEKPSKDNRYFHSQTHLNALNSALRSININEIKKRQTKDKIILHFLINNIKLDILMNNGIIRTQTKKPTTFSAYNNYVGSDQKLEYCVLLRLPISNLNVYTTLAEQKFKLLESTINDIGFNIRLHPNDKTISSIDLFSKINSVNSIVSALELQSVVKFVNELVLLKSIFSSDVRTIEANSNNSKSLDLPSINAITFINMISFSIEQVPEYGISYIINSLLTASSFESDNKIILINSNLTSHHLSLESNKEVDKKTVNVCLPSFSSNICIDTKDMTLDSNLNVNYVHNSIDLSSFKHLYIFQSIMKNEVTNILSIINQNVSDSNDSKSMKDISEKSESIFSKYKGTISFKGTELSIIGPSAAIIIYSGSFNTKVTSPTDKNERVQFIVDLENFCFIFTSQHERSHIYDIDENIVKADNIDIWAGLTTCISIQSYPDDQFNLFKNQKDLTSLWIKINNTYALIKPWVVERMLHVWLYVSEYYRSIKQEKIEIMKSKNKLEATNNEKQSDDNITSFIENKNIVFSIMINNVGLCIPTQTLESKYMTKSKFYDIEPRTSVIITLDYFHISIRKKIINDIRSFVAYAKFDNFFIGYKPVHTRLHLHNQNLYQRMDINFLNIKTGDIKLCLHYKTRSTICDLNIHSSGFDICLNANIFNYYYIFKRDILLNSNKIYKIIEDMNKQSDSSLQIKQPKIEDNKFELNIKILTDSGSIQFFTCSTQIIKGLNYKAKKENKMQHKIEDIISSSAKLTSGQSDSYLTIDSRGNKKKLYPLFEVPLPSCNIRYHKKFDNVDKKSKTEDNNTLYILIDSMTCNISPDFVIFYHELSANMQMIDKIFKDEIVAEESKSDNIEKDQSVSKKTQNDIETPTLSNWNVLLNIKPSVLKLTCEPYSETICIVKTDDIKVLYQSNHDIKDENRRIFKRSVLIELKRISLESYNPHHEKNNMSFEVDMLRFHFNYSIKDYNHINPISNPITIFIRLRSTSSHISLPYLSELFIFKKVWTEDIYSYHFQSEYNDKGINKKMGVLDVLLQDKFILVDIELGSVCVKVDLGPSISLVSANTKGTKVKFSSFGRNKHDELGEEFILSALLEEVVTLFEGPLNGNLTFSGLEISTERRLNDEKTGINRFNAIIKPISSFLSYNLSPVLLLISKEMNFIAQDSIFVNDQDRKMSGVDIDIVTKSIYLQISSESISTPPKIVQRILQNIKKSKLKADTHVNSIDKLLKLRSEINKLRQKVEDSSVKNKHSQLQLQQQRTNNEKKPAYTAGKIKISGQDLNLRLFGYNLHDPSWMQLHINSFRINLYQKVNDDTDIIENKIIYRELSMILGDTSLSKFIENAESRNKRNMEKWERKAKAENIFKLPTTTTILHSVHDLNSNTIDVYYVSKFKSSISVSVVLGLYNDLKDIINVYIKIVENNLFDWISSKTSEVIEDNEDKERTFICKKFEFNPSINVLGDFTPSISTVFGWLGIKKAEETIPKYSHKITDTLEEVLIFVDQFSKMIAKSRRKQLS